MVTAHRTAQACSRPEDLRAQGSGGLCPRGVLGWESSEGLPPAMSSQRVRGETLAKRRKVLLDRALWGQRRAQRASLHV